MSKITITEALAELKTIDKRLEKKREFIFSYLYRQEQFKDPLLNEGGSVVVLQRERQSISDLENRKVRIRKAINDANDNVSLKIGGMEQTISEWLVWKRDVAPGLRKFLQNLSERLALVRQDAMRKGVTVVSSGNDPVAPNDVIVNINEKKLSEELEELETVLGNLDGQLSLKNATILISVD